MPAIPIPELGDENYHTVPPVGNEPFEEPEHDLAWHQNRWERLTGWLEGDYREHGYTDDEIDFHKLYEEIEDIEDWLIDQNAPGWVST